MGCVYEAGDFLGGIGYQDRLEVVAVFQAVADAGGDGIDILQGRGILNAVKIVGNRGLDEVAGEFLGDGPGSVFVGAGDGQIG